MAYWSCWPAAGTTRMLSKRTSPLAGWVLISKRVLTAQFETAGTVGAGVGHVLHVTGHSVRIPSPCVASLHIVATAAQFGANPPVPVNTSAADPSVHCTDVGVGAGAGVGHVLHVTGHSVRIPSPCVASLHIVATAAQLAASPPVAADAAASDESAHFGAAGAGTCDEHSVVIMKVLSWIAIKPLNMLVSGFASWSSVSPIHTPALSAFIMDATALNVVFRMNRCCVLVYGGIRSQLDTNIMVPSLLAIFPSMTMQLANKHTPPNTETAPPFPP